MPEQMNVLYLPKWYPCKNNPLKGIFIQRHAESVLKYCEVTVLYVVVDSGAQKKLLEYEVVSERGINTVRVYYKKKITGIDQVDKVIKSFLYIVGIFSGYRISQKKFGKPTLIHVHVLWRPVLLALYLKVFKKIKYLIAEHWTGYLPSDGTYQKMNFFKKILYRIAVKNAELVTPDATELGNWMSKCGLLSTYITVPNVVDVELFKSSLQGKKSKKRIIHISSLNDLQKNVSGLIRVVKRVWSERKDFELFIIGNTYDFEVLKKRAQEANLLNEVVFFKGRKVGQELADLLSSGDFFVLFSNYENQPCVINEALSCSVPVLATKVGDIPSIVSDQLGKLVEPGNEENLYAEINFFLDHFEKFDKSVLRNYAVSNYSKENVGRKLFEIYRSIV